MSENNKDKQNLIDSLGLEVSGHRIFYLKSGSGPPVLLLHGGASDSRDWIATMSSLSHRFSFYAPDLPGFGRAERRESGYYLSDYSDFIIEFSEMLGLGNAALVGHSLGGRIALDAVQRCPDRYNRLVLVDSAGLGQVSFLGTFALNVFKTFRKILGLHEPYPRFLPGEEQGQEWSHAKGLSEIKVPTLIIWKQHDLYLPLSLARRACAMIPGASLVVIPGYGHAPHCQGTEAFTAHLLDFLSGD